VRRRLVLSHVLLVAMVLIALEVPLGLLFARRQHADLVESATRQAALIATFVGPDFDQPVQRSLDVILHDLPTGAPSEVTVLDRAGRVLVARHSAVPDDLDPTPAGAARAAITGALTTGDVVDDGQRWTFAAVPVTSRDSQVGAVVVSLPRHETDERIVRAWWLLGGLAAGILALAALVAALVTRWLGRPIDQLAAAVADFSSGELDREAPTGHGPTELRELAATFNDMAQRLARLLDSQRGFLADASHQLRGPLTALRLRIETLDGAPAADVEATLAEADRLARLLDGLLALSRGEGAAVEPVRVDVDAVVADRIDAWAPLGAEHGIELRRGGTSASASAWVGRGHLEQVLDNLIANSLEASAPGSTIEVGAVAGPADPAPASGVSVAVVDHGRGMSPEQLEHAFDRFWQSDSRPPGGAGLGLSIVEQLVAANGGQIHLRPTEGGGLTATVTLPAAP
jgi:signal transduction histidine kinase